MSTSMHPWRASDRVASGKAPILPAPACPITTPKSLCRAQFIKPPRAKPPEPGSARLSRSHLGRSRPSRAAQHGAPSHKAPTHEPLITAPLVKPPLCTPSQSLFSQWRRLSFSYLACSRRGAPWRFPRALLQAFRASCAALPSVTTFRSLLSPHDRDGSRTNRPPRRAAARGRRGYLAAAFRHQGTARGAASKGRCQRRPLLPSARVPAPLPP